MTRIKITIIIFLYFYIKYFLSKYEYINFKPNIYVELFAITKYIRTHTHVILTNILINYKNSLIIILYKNIYIYSIMLHFLIKEC